MPLIIFIVSIVVLGLIPSFAWLIFYLHEDFKHHQPKRLILTAFLIGAAVTFIVLPVEIALNNHFAAVGVVSNSFQSFTGLAAIEELFKFFAAYFFIHKLRQFDEPLDAMIYPITVALGFAAVENIATLFQVAHGTIFNVSIIESLTLRFAGATLLHSLASGLAGYYWGWSFFHPRRKWLLIAGGLGVATVLHAVFNYLIIKTGPAGLAIGFVVFVSFFLLSDFEKFKKVDVKPAPAT